MKKTIVLFFVILVLFIGCQSSPSAIGLDAIETVGELSDQQNESQGLVEGIQDSVSEVGTGLEQLKEKAPEELRPEIQTVIDKNAIADSKIKELKDSQAVEATLTEELNKAILDGIKATSRINDEKNEALIAKEKAEKWAVIGWGILGMLFLVVIVAGIVKIRGAV